MATGVVSDLQVHLNDPPHVFDLLDWSTHFDLSALNSGSSSLVSSPARDTVGKTLHSHNDASLQSVDGMSTSIFNAGGNLSPD